MLCRARIVSLILASACAGLPIESACGQQAAPAVIKFSTPPRIEFVSAASSPSGATRTAAANAEPRSPGAWTLQERTPAASPSDVPPSLPAVPGSGLQLENPRIENQRDSLAPLQNLPLSTAIISVNTSMSGIGTGLVPDSHPERLSEMAVGLPNGGTRGAALQCVHWQASHICHFPLYFEDAMLERHGHVRFGRLQPWASGVKFFTTISLLPYLRTLQPACEPRYALGQYRAGSCAPLLRDNLPWDQRAAAVETLSLAGLFWAAPL